VNGSGKHNNWSITTDSGKNLLDPGARPWENLPFLLILAAVIQGVDEYQDLLRISVASAGNDRRLGANEAPPAIVSMFLGDELTAVLQAIEEGKPYTQAQRKKLETGVRVLPDFNMDNTDRNRTSPFAFTGNKFEFRSLGSALSIACPNIMLNTIVAEELRRFSDILEQSPAPTGEAVYALIRQVLGRHKRIIFNGDGYSAQWVEEAKRRGLLNLPTTADAMPRYLDQKNVALFIRHKIYTEAEMEARYETIMEEYVKTLNIEALTMARMVRGDILPAVSGYASSLAQGVAARRQLIPGLPCTAETGLIEGLSALLDRAYAQTSELEALLRDPSSESVNILTAAVHYRDKVLPAMEALRRTVDQMEQRASGACWPYPTYAQLMFNI